MPFPIVLPCGSANWRYRWATGQREEDRRVLVLMAAAVVAVGRYDSGLQQPRKGTALFYSFQPCLREHLLSRASSKCTCLNLHAEWEQAHGLRLRDVSCFWSKDHPSVRLQHPSLSFLRLQPFQSIRLIHCLKYLTWLPFASVPALIYMDLLCDNPSGEGCKAEDVVRALTKCVISLGPRTNTFEPRVNKAK